jgi:hypothetical protein
MIRERWGAKVCRRSIRTRNLSCLFCNSYSEVVRIRKFARTPRLRARMAIGKNRALLEYSPRSSSLIHRPVTLFSLAAL